MMAIAAPESPRALEVLSQAYFENGDNHAALMAADDSLFRTGIVGRKELVAARFIGWVS